MINRPLERRTLSRQTDDALIEQLASGTNHRTVNDRAESAQTGTLTTRQGHPISNNQSLRTVGNRGPATLENYSRRTVKSATSRSRSIPAHGYSRRPVSARRSLSASPPSSTAVPPGDAARSPRICRQVLHGGRQLGPGRQQSEGLLHPRCHQVPGYHPCLQAGPGH